jgi:hypothetical protein
MNITSYVLNEVYGDRDEGSLFISLQTINGFIYSAHLYDQDAEETRRPRVIITSVD